MLEIESGFEIVTQHVDTAEKGHIHIVCQYLLQDITRMLTPT
jgi:hypothetical protein